jgi:hypothetical protein
MKASNASKTNAVKDVLLVAVALWIVFCVAAQILLLIF